MEPMYREPFESEPESDFLTGVAKIALGIFFGALLVWGAIELRARYELQEVAAALQTQASRLHEQQRAQSERRTSQARAMEQLKQDQIRRTAEARQATIVAERKKAAAWRAFYQPSSECLAAASVDCGNAHIRARREFERRYSAGEL